MRKNATYAFGVRKLSVIAMILGISLGFGSITPTAANPLNVYIEYLDAKTQYNAIALVDASGTHINLYDAQSLLKRKSPELSVLPNSPTHQLALNEYIAEQGMYTIQWGDALENIALLVVTASPTKPSSKIAIIVPDYTWMAYDKSGGGSFYQPHFGKYTYISKSRMPLNTGRISHKAVNNPISLVQWHVNGPVDVIKQSEVVSRHYKLNKYKLIVLYGHDEYWTPPLRTQIKNAISGGTNLLNISGNTGYREIQDTGNSIKLLRSGRIKKVNEIGKSTLKFFGTRYLGRPTCYNLEVDKIKASTLSLALTKKGFPKSISSKDFKQSLCGLFINERTDPLLRGVRLNSYGFLPATSLHLVGDEIDGIPMTSQWKVIQPWPGFVKDSQIQVVASTWANQNAQRTGLIVRTKLGRGKIISIGSIDWVAAANAGNDGALKITQNALTELLK